jgi:hypothetical protein
LVGRRSGGGGGIFFNKVSWLQPPLDNNVEKILGMGWFSRTYSGGGISESPWSFIGGYSFFASGTDVIFFTCSVTSRLQPTTSGQHREEQQRRRRAADTVWRLKTKDISRILL